MSDLFITLASGTLSDLDFLNTIEEKNQTLNTFEHSIVFIIQSYWSFLLFQLQEFHTFDINILCLHNSNMVKIEQNLFIFKKNFYFLTVMSFYMVHMVYY